MACGCNGGTPEPNTSQQEYVVMLPDGSQKVVQGEAAAKIEITMAGGGSYSRR